MEDQERRLGGRHVLCYGRTSPRLPSTSPRWETSDFLQLGLVGTQGGVLVVVNLVTGALVGTCRYAGY